MIVAGAVPEVVFKGVDAGASYFSWRWLDDLHRPSYEVVSAAHRDRLLRRFDAALPYPRDARSTGQAEETTAQAVARAMDGMLMHRDTEVAFFRDAAGVLLPDGLRVELVAWRTALVAEGRSEVRPVLRIHPSPATARIPWELLVIDRAGTRLVEVADVRLEVPVAVRAERDDRLRSGSGRPSWAQVRSGPVVYLLDPRTRMGAVLGSDGADLTAMMNERIQAGRVSDKVTDLNSVLHKAHGRVWLSEQLCAQPPPSRLVYVGHVSAAVEESHKPEAAAMHLSDPACVYGHANPLGNHRPFTALDLLVGTAAIPAPTDDQHFPFPAGVLGYDIWPMPLRVALLACDSGSDHRFAEPFGLVMALIANGAELVTATRWALPTDEAFRVFRPEVDPAVNPTSSMIAAVDAAHESDDALAALQDWQRERLTAWREHGQAQDSPMIWAAIATHHAPELPAEQVWSVKDSG